MHLGVDLENGSKYMCICRLAYTDMEMELLWHEDSWYYPNTLERINPHGKVVRIIKKM